MQYKNTYEAILIQLSEIQQQIALLSSEEPIRNIDLDLSLAKLRDIYDLMLSLRHEHPEMPNPILSEEPAPKEEFIKDEPAFIIEDNEDVYETYEFEPDPEEESPVIEKEKNHTPKISKIKTESVQSDGSSLGEQFSSTRPTLHEELSTQVDNSDLANTLKNRPITNLSSAIGLNEKFEFINELFNGDKEEYEKTIEKLNIATNFNEAYNYLSTKLNWNMSSPMAQRILELIRRKLIVKKHD
jgi:hypothetical protein